MQIPLFKPPVPQWIEEAGYNLCITDAEVKNALNQLDSGEFIALDVETSGLKAFRDKLVGISMSSGVGQGFYFPLNHERGVNIDPDVFETWLVPFISNRSFVFHNGQFDYGFLQKAGMTPTILSDTLFLARSYDYRRDNRLKPLSESMLGLDVIELMDLSEGDNFNFAYFSPEESYLYACQDADLTYRLYLQMRNQEKVTDYIHRLEMDIVPPIASMESLGFPVDLAKAKVHHQTTRDRLKELEAAIHSYAGMSFNIGSSEQLIYVLFDKLGLQPTRHTDSGKISTGEKSLKDIKNDHPIVPLLLEWREMQKMDSSFYTPYFRRIEDQGVSRIYSHFNPLGARTGRFSSSDVNLQQVSKSVKEIFVPEDGYYLVEADYSQIEYRIFASMCRDPYMMQAFMDGKDMHLATTERLRPFLGLGPDEEITDDIRKKGKTLNFSVLFGSGDRNVAGQLQCSVQEARALINAYYEQFPTVADWKERMQRDAVAAGYCETKFGRRRYISQLDYFDESLYQYTKTGLPRDADQHTKDRFYKLLHGLRIAVNTPVQGTAADIFKVALRRLQRDVLSKMDVKLHAIVHDSFIMSVHESIDPEEFTNKLRSITEIQIPDYVPILMDVKFGYNWKTLVELEEFKEKRNVATRQKGGRDSS